MVFSETTPITQSILKVVEIDRLKPGKNLKNLQANGSTVITGGKTGLTPPSPVATTSYSEVRQAAAVYLKQEQPFESKMFHDPDSEFFQDLGLLCFEPAKEEQAPSTDSAKEINECAHNTDTLYTPFSPQGLWDFDANSSANGGFYHLSPNAPLSPIGFAPIETKFPCSPDAESENKVEFQSDVVDINSLPVVFGELASEKMVDLNLCPATQIGHFVYTHDKDNTKTDTHKMLLLDQEDSLEQRLGSVMPRDLHNEIVISKDIDSDQNKYGAIEPRQLMKRGSGLSLDLTASVPWNEDFININTPDVVTVVDQMEKENCALGEKLTEPWTFTDIEFISEDICPMTTVTAPVEYEPVTPKSESLIETDGEDTTRNKRRRHHDSEDSDATYTPHSEHTPRKYNRRKPNIPLQKIISALEESQMQPKARRGRPPKRRESTVSSVCSVEDNMSSVSTHETKYRELRDKNNEASKRSRMNRKLKELQMEQQVIELEDRNKKLKVKADILEDMTKRLKDALMTAILQK